MTITPLFIHYVAAAFPIVAASVGVALGEGIAVMGMLDGADRQIWAFPQITRSMFYGLFLIEGGGVVPLVTSLWLLLSPSDMLTWPMVLAELGIALGVGLACGSVACAAGGAVRETLRSVARQPFHTPKLLSLMMPIMTLIETPGVFAFVISVLIRAQITESMTLLQGAKLCAAGCTVGLGALGPALGQWLFAQRACAAAGQNRQAFGQIFNVTFMTQALMETPVILAFVLAIMLVLRSVPPALPLLGAAAFFAVALTIGVGAAGSAIGIGILGGKACLEIARDTRVYSLLFGSTLIAQIMIETSSLFAFVVAMMILLKVTV